MLSLVVKIDALVFSREGKMCVDHGAEACRSMRSVDPGGREGFRGKAEARALRRLRVVFGEG
jgi:hypothetical protein